MGQFLGATRVLSMLSKRKSQLRGKTWTACIGGALLLAGCNGQVDNALLTTSPQPQNGLVIEPTAGTDTQYRMGTGDKIRLKVYGEPELSGEYVIDGAGWSTFR